MSKVLINSHCHLNQFPSLQGWTNHIFIHNPLNKAELQTALNHTNTHPDNKILLSTGQHPLYPPDSITTTQAFNLLDQKKLFAIGEIGFDKRNPDNAWQQQMFLRFCDIARQYHKPIIVHCVGYYYDIYKLIKRLFPKMIVVLHSFQGTIEVIKKFSELNTVFSLHKSILRIRNSAKIVQEILTNRNYLFETDADENIDISHTIKTIANFTNTDEKILINKQYNTFETICRSESL